MTLNSRERKIAIALGAVVGVYVLFAWVIKPHIEKRNALTDQIGRRNADIFLMEKKLTQQKANEREWERMGVKIAPADADTRLAHYLTSWAQEARLTISSSKPERATADKGFIQITTRATATGSQAAVVRLIWAIAQSPVPIRVNEMNLATKKEGTDDLMLTFSLSTLCVDPDAGKPPVRGGGSRGVASAGLNARSPS